MIVGFDRVAKAASGRGWPVRISLSSISLTHAVLTCCFLAKADLRGSGLEGVSLTVSDLRGTDLRGGSLFSARLAGARLEGTEPSGANLRCAIGLTDAQLSVSRTDASTILPDGSAGPFQPGSAATEVNADDCTHWQPDADTPELLKRLPPASPPSALPEPDLSPIPDLKQRTGPAEPPPAAIEPGP